MSSKICYGEANIPLSPAVRAGDFIYISGQVPVFNGKIIGASIEDQTKQVLKNLESALQLAGCKLSDVVKTFVVLPNMQDFPGFNAAYSQVFTANRPARTTVGAKLAGDFKVEIEAVAYKPKALL